MPEPITDSTGVLLPDNSEHREARRILREHLDNALKHAPESLVRTDELRTAQDFREIAPIIVIIQRYLSHFRSADSYGWIGPRRLSELARIGSTAANLFQDIKGFQPGDHNGRQRIIKACSDLWEEVCVHYSPHVAFDAVVSESLQSLPERVHRELQRVKDSTAHDIRTLSDSLLQSGHAKLSEVDAALERVRQVEASVRSAAEQAGINAQARFFEHEARRHARLSFAWMTAIIVAGGTVAYYTVCVLEPQLIALARTAQVNSEPLHGVIAITISRVTVLSMLWFVVLWCSRNFSAHRHNVVVNRHRHNAISSFRAFAEGAENDPATKNAILLSATQSVFAPQSSGYLKTDADAPQSPTSQIIEVFRGAASGRSND